MRRWYAGNEDSHDGLEAVVLHIIIEGCDEPAEIIPIGYAPDPDDEVAIGVCAEHFDVSEFVISYQIKNQLM